MLEILTCMVKGSPRLMPMSNSDKVPASDLLRRCCGGIIIDGCLFVDGKRLHGKSSVGMLYN